MHEGAPRSNGGPGFAIEGPCAQLDIVEAEQFIIHDERPHPMSGVEVAALHEALKRLENTFGLGRRAEILISGGMLTHVGMGSGTAIRLSALEGVALLNGVSIEREQLVTASGRGGTSGVGVSTYFNGGFVFDLGRPNEGIGIRPSSQIMPRRPSLSLPSVPMPDWPMLLCIPHGIAAKTQQEEIAFFNRVTPLDSSASYQATYVALFDLYASVVERDYVGFCRGVDQIQQTAWKRAERDQYGAELSELDRTLRTAGAECVGMSGFGPMLFCFAAERMDSVAVAASAMGCRVHRVAPRNRGRKLIPCNA